MRNLLVAAGLGASVATLVAYWMTSRQPAPRPLAEASVSEAEHASPAAQTVPERRPRSAGEMARAGSMMGDRRGGEAQRQQAERPAPPPPKAAPAGPIVDDYPKFLESSFERESVDISWAKETESKMYGALATLPDLRVVGARCRSTMCRFEVAYQSKAAAETFRTDYVQLEPFSNTTAYEQRLTGPDGHVSGVIITFARQNHSLPQSAPESPN
jgi:hypothetical protein